MNKVFGQRLQWATRNCSSVMSFQRRGNSWRGGGGGNYRGGRRNRYYNEAERDEQSGQSSNDFGFSRGQGGGKRGHSRYEDNNERPKSKRPPHLRGRAIGLYFRDLGARERTERREKVKASIRKGFSVTLTPERQQNLTELIRNLDSTSFLSSKASFSFQRKYQKNLQRNLEADVKTEFYEQQPIKQEPSTSNSDMTSAIKTEFSHTFIKQEHNDDDTDADAAHDEFKGLSYLFSAKCDPLIDDHLKLGLEMKEQSRGYQKMLELRKSLPTYKLRDEIVDLIHRNQVVVLSGETGCGKTTQVPQFILDAEIRANRGSMCNIICTQPRRISTISVAERVASERDENIGESVGYSIRLEHRFTSRSSGIITFMTTGVIFQCLKFNKSLDNVSHLIIDEIHERSIHSDFLLTILKDLIIRRPTLKVILMSATMSAMDFKNYFGNATTIYHIPGFTFPIKEYYLEDAIAHTKFSFGDSNQSSSNYGDGFRRRKPNYNSYEHEEFIGPYLRELENSRAYSPFVIQQLANPESEELNVDFIHTLVEYICDTDPKNGAILIFATGWDIISKIISNFEDSGRFPSHKFRIYPLHSMMPTVNQKEIFQRPPPGVRKIIVATQIAETSITIDDILWVIDAGKIKLGNFDEGSNLATLDTEWVSLANAIQRRGRAGRVQAGNCYHLFSKPREETLEKFKKPEVLRTRLEEIVLQIKVLELGKAADFLKRLMNPPSDRSIYLAIERLRELHALDENENLTPLGYHLAQLPMDPQTGKMILMGAIFSCADPIFSIAASLSFKDPFYIPLGKEKQVDAIRRRFSDSTKSDHILVARVIQAYERAVADGNERSFCYKNFLSQNTLKMLINMKQQFADYLNKLGFLSTTNCKDRELNRNSNNIGIVTALTGAGLYPNVVRVNAVGKHGRIVLRADGHVVKFHPGSVNANEREFESPYIVYYKKIRSSNVFLHDTTMVSPFALIFFGGRLDWISANNEEEEDAYGSSSSSKFDSVSVDGNKLVFSYPSQQNFRFIVESLRRELDSFLEHKVNNPGPTDWTAGSKENELLNAITDILTSEYAAFMYPNDEEDDEDNYR